MTYKEILNQLAKEDNTTPDKVENEMKNALKLAGLDIEPNVFIALAKTKIVKDYIS